jgi:hypothetical protein
MPPEKKITDLSVTFVGLNKKEEAPHFAVYQIDAARRPIKKIGGYDGERLKMELGDAKSIALGPDVEDFTELPNDNLVPYRVAPRLSSLWRKNGVVLPFDLWDRFHIHLSCVSGTINKCRPWFFNHIEALQLNPIFDRVHVERIESATERLLPKRLFLPPQICQPLCDGIVEIYERECCCQHIHIHIPTLIGKLRDILEVLPIPIPDPNPGPIPPDPDPWLFSPRLLRAKSLEIQQREMAMDLASVPSEELFEDYHALSKLPVEEAHVYIRDRSYLFPIFCQCSLNKVGETPIEPGGRFDFCYPTSHHFAHHEHCVKTYAYKIKQLVNGVLTTIYDGLAANQYFSGSGPANIKTYNPQADVCDGLGDPPVNGDQSIMLEYVGAPTTHHFNFPQQTGVSQVEVLDADDGTYTTDAPDCPWGGSLGLRLWFPPALESIVKYYRLKVFKVNDNGGTVVGTEVLLNNSVSWQRLVNIPGGLGTASDLLGPIPVGTETNLFKVPYWGAPDRKYTSGQFHQVWDTTKFSDGKYMLVVEVFNAAGARIKPNGAAGPGIGQPFLFQRWTSAIATSTVAFSDLAHIFWVDNTPVGGDIVDLRKGDPIPIPNTDECQFMIQAPGTSSTFSIGYRAFHKHGVEHAGNGDNNSFMWYHHISWQRGLNGGTGTLGPAGSTNHTDVGETPVGGMVVPAAGSGTQTFTEMLAVPIGVVPVTVTLQKCSFSVTLRVYAKHFNGSTRLSGYDYSETASFALEIAS